MITGSFNHVSMYKAFCLKLTSLQIMILNAYIQNWIAGQMVAYDPENPENRLYWFNTYFWSGKWGISIQRLSAAVASLTKPIKAIDGISIQILFTKRTSRGVYIGMFSDIMHLLIADNYNFFNGQCVYHNKPELQYFPVVSMMSLEKSEGLDNPIISNMRPIFQIEDQTEGKDIWAESIIKELCMEAKKEKAYVCKNDKMLPVFSHLNSNNEFRAKRGRVDKAIRLVGDLYTGRFFRDNPVHSLFGEIAKDHLEFKNVDMAVKRIMMLKGNKEGIRKFLLKCLRNYFDALKPGQETYSFIKSAFPRNILDFILFDDHKGNHVANFLLFYTSTLSVMDKQVHDIKARIKKSVPECVFDKFCDYENFLLEKQIQSYWLNVGKLSKEILAMRRDGRTSYMLESCYDQVFDKIDVMYRCFKVVLPGYFDPGQKTASDALLGLMDR